MVAPVVEERRAAAIRQPRVDARVEAQLLLVVAAGLGLLALPLVRRLIRRLAGVLLGALGGGGPAEERDPRAVGAPGRLGRALTHLGETARLAAADIDQVELRLVAITRRDK